MQAFLDAWLAQAKKFQIPSEINIVEWNPPASRPRLRESLAWPADLGPCEVRFIEVPAAVHQQIEHADAIPLHQMIAKNVGIRRARGDFVLATNIDIILSAELMQFLAERRLASGTMYRTDRHDVPDAIPANAGTDELLAFCQSHALRVSAREGTVEFAAGGLRRLESPDIVAPEAGIHLGPGWFPVESNGLENFRWLQTGGHIAVPSHPRAGAQLLIDVETGPSAGGQSVILEIAGDTGSALASAGIEGRCKLRLRIPAEIPPDTIRFRIHAKGIPLSRDPRFLNLRVFDVSWSEEVAESGPDAAQAWSLQVIDSRPGVDWASTREAASPLAAQMHDPAYLHTNACGDFTLLAREHWFALRGYAEFPIWPMHIDALFCYAAHHAGIRETILPAPMRAFHIQHSCGAGWTPEGEAARHARIQAKGVPQVSYSDWMRWVDEMRRFNAPVIFTLDNWGLADMAFPETTVPATSAQ